MVSSGRQNAPLIVVNEKWPVPPKIALSFEHDLVISEDGWDPVGLFLDNSGNICVISGNALFKFDSAGRNILRKEFRKGQGPGEFRGMDPAFAADGRIFIFDTMQHRITILDERLEPAKILKLGFFGSLLQLDSQNRMYCLMMKALPGTTDVSRLVLTQYSDSGKFLKEFAECRAGAKPDFQDVRHLAYFGPQLRYRIGPEDRVYYALTDRYEIAVASPDGTPLRKITKTGTTRKITEKERKKYVPEPQDKRRLTVIDLPERMPPIADFFLLDDGFLLVVTFENGEDDPFLAGDLFDDKGILQAQVQVPKYKAWDWLFFPTKSLAAWKDNRFYTIETDPTEENPRVVRYKAVWKKAEK